VQLKVYGDEAVVRQEALDAARESLRLTENQYKAGLIGYLDVVSVQTTALSNERSVLTLLQGRLLASVQLIAALGGGWDDSRRWRTKGTELIAVKGLLPGA
jgi:outer membrane protein TolC